MTIWILSAGSAGAALAGPEQARQQVAQIQTRLQKNPDLASNVINLLGQQWRGHADGNHRRYASRGESDAARLALVAGIVGVDNRLDVGSHGVQQAVSDAGLKRPRSKGS